MKKIKDNPLMQIVILLAAIVGIILFLFVDSFEFAPKRITRRNETLADIRIPRQMDDVTILFFSDLEYGTFLKEERLDSFVKTVNNASADIIVFGGDLYENDAAVDEESVNVLKTALKSIKAPLGKFAVYGDNDHKSDEALASVTDILESSGFEILNNRSVLLHNLDSQSVTLVGLDNGLNGAQDIAAAYSNVSPDSYVITVCHTPDTAKKVPADLTDYFLSGHSHGGQVYYIFGATYTPAMATEYLRGKHNISDKFTLDITNGVGTAVKDERFLSYAEFAVYTLHSTAPLPTPSPSPTPEAEETTDPAQSPEEQTEQPAEEVPYEEPAEVIPEDTVPEEPAAQEPASEEEPAPAEEETPAEPEQSSEEETSEDNNG